jgi:hypothetical protein
MLFALIFFLQNSINVFCVRFQELTKFINHCNEIKAANVASKEGGDFNIVKADGDQSKPKK